MSSQWGGVRGLAVACVVLVLVLFLSPNAIAVSSSCTTATSFEWPDGTYEYLESGVHWWKFTTTTDADLEVVLDSPPGDEFHLYLFDDDCWDICINDATGDEDKTCTLNNAPAGTYRVGVFAYIGSGTYWIDVSAYNGELDLQPYSITTDPNPPVANEPFNVYYNYRNNGEGVVSGRAVTTQVSFDGQTTTCTRTSLNKGQTAQCTIGAVTKPAGTYSAQEIVDYYGDISETNEGNNIRRENISVVAAPEYDLVVNGLNTIPADFDDEDTFTLRAEVENYGPDAITSPFSVSLYDETVELQKCDYSGLGVYSAVTCSVDDQQLANGYHELRAVADSTGKIPETNEDNEFKIYPIVGYCDLKLLSKQVLADNDCFSPISARFDYKNTGVDDMGYTLSWKLYDPGGALIGTYSSPPGTIAAGSTLPAQKDFAPPGGKWSKSGTYQVKAEFYGACESPYTESSVESVYPAEPDCITCEGTGCCTNPGDYFCQGGDVYQCLYNGTYYEGTLREFCGFGGRYCNPLQVNTTHACSVDPANVNVWLDHADVGVKVNKQTGDILKVNVYASAPTVASLDYDTNVFSGDCQLGGIVFSSAGVKSCNLTVADDAPYGETRITVGSGHVAVAEVLQSADLVIVTDSAKLYERFPLEDDGVKTVLKQAYLNAEDDGVVYDLSWYDFDEPHPFGAFSAYNEKLTSPSMRDNSYVLAVSSFVNDRCSGCSDVMIVGDDYVVPSYRRGIPTLFPTWLFWSKEGVKDIYTDFPYASRSMAGFSAFPELFAINGVYKGKDVLIILPTSISPEMRAQVDRMKQVLTSKYDPDFTEMNGGDAHCVDETFFNNASRKTLIIIGTEANNNAFKCMPFVAGDFNEDAAFMQPNVWDTDEYSVVINTDDPAVLKFTTYLIENETITKLRSESAYYFHIGTQVASYTALGVGVFAMVAGSGGMATPGALIFAAGALDAISDSSDVVDSCVINNEGNLWCGVSAGFVVVPLVSSRAGKDLLKSLGGQDMENMLQALLGPYKELIEKNLPKVKGIFGKSSIARALKSPAEIVYGAKGVDETQKLFGGTVTEALERLKYFGYADDDALNVRTLKRLGQTADEFVANGWKRFKPVKSNQRVWRGVEASRYSESEIRALMNGNGLEAIDSSKRELEKHLVDGDFQGVPGYTDGSAFISTSKADVVGKRFALGEKYNPTTKTYYNTHDGWVFEIAPRSGNAIDSVNMLNDLKFSDDPVLDKWVKGGLEGEIEVTFVDNIPPEDIVKATYYDINGVKGVEIVNPKFKP